MIGWRFESFQNHILWHLDSSVGIDSVVGLITQLASGSGYYEPVGTLDKIPIWRAEM